MRIRTTNEFIEAAQLVHGERFNYDQVKYVRSYLKVSILCRLHGTFDQQPDHHLSGQGCRKCSDEYRRAGQAPSTDQFIAAAKRIHPDEDYDYGRCVYLNRAKKVIIGCPKHGWFEQSPMHHLRGSGCKTCSAERAAAANTSDTPRFIAKAGIVWGARYLYTATKYVDSSRGLTITCREHGEFTQRACKHLEGVQGCKSCSRIERTTTYNTKYVIEFVNTAQTIKDNRQRYTYKNFVYTGSHAESTIDCNIHKKPFSQSPSNHLSGKGCPLCCVRGKYHWHYFCKYPEMKAVPAILYLLQFSLDDEEFFKLGITRNALNIRYAYKRHYDPYHLRPIRIVECHLFDAWQAEQSAILTLNKFRYHPKRRSMSGNRECFVMSALPALAEHMDELEKRCAMEMTSSRVTK